MFLKNILSVYFFQLGGLDLQLLKKPFFDLPNNYYFSPHDVLLKLAELENGLSLDPDGILNSL